jgi:hypothetical protein
MMMAKVICVQLINHLGYDLLFQDVDIVWYKNPLEYFHDKNNDIYDFDIYFQDDGSRSIRFAPSSANSGFYYVRNNRRTRYMFTSLLYSGDLVLQSHSHQQALIQVMTEHASQFGLRAKVLDRDMETFPCGWHYHRRRSLMKKIVKGEVVPEIFHMSFTDNKDNKMRYFQQMGKWHVNENCVAKKSADISGLIDSDEVAPLIEPCCLLEPEIICHYSDKPSIIPCMDSPPIDEGQPSFWKENEYS